MYSLETIKQHFKNLIPNIIVKSQNGDGEMNCLVGIITLYINQLSKYEIEYIDQKNNNQNNKHFGFILSRLLLHGLLGHKKSVFNKNRLIKNSPTVFKDLEENIRYLSTFFGEDIYNHIDYVDIKNKTKIEKEGDSGFFLEYFFGKIYDIYTTDLIDKLIKNKIDLSILFGISLWYKKMDIMKDYVKYKYFLKEKYNCLKT